jgi:hypothetical protein
MNAAIAGGACRAKKAPRAIAGFSEVRATDSMNQKLLVTLALAAGFIS